MTNKAAELGPRQFKWWPDWRGECVAIVASGPSTKTAKVEQLRNRIHVIAIKENVNLCPWADVVYGCDEAWWVHRKGLPEYKGIKISQAVRACAVYKDIHKVDIIDPRGEEILLEKPGLIGSGSNSGFQGLNLAEQFGATGILLVGFDVHRKQGLHWYGPNTADRMSNPDENNFKRWIKAFTAAAPGIKARGVDVVNASHGSALDCFRKASIDVALKGWGL